MVQEIVPTRFGSELGQALRQGVTEGGEMGLQRGMLKQALGELSNLPPNASGFDLAKSLISATAGIPGAERYVGQLFPELLKESKRRQLTEATKRGGLGGISPTLPQGSELPGSPGGIPGSSKEISLEEMDKLASELNLDPEEVYSFYEARNQRILAERERYRNALAERTGVSDPKDLAIVERFAQRPEIQKQTNPQLKADLVAKEWQKYEATRSAFAKEAAERPNAFANQPNYKRKLETLASSAKPLLEAGEYDIAHRDLAANGWSESEIAKILNPLSKDIKSAIEKIPKASLGEMLAHEQLGKYSKTVKILEDKLADLIRPGEVDARDPNLITPGTSLIQLRTELQRKGIQFDEFDRILNRLIQSGRVNLDRVQQRERELLASSPNRVYSIWETLFPGKR